VLNATGGNPIDVGEIQRVNVSVYQAALDLLGNVKPSTPYLAKFSLPFCVATALKFGHVNLLDFNEKRLEDPDLLWLMERINIISDPELSQNYPRKWPARVEVITKDDKSLEGTNEYPKGDPENPLEESDVVEKFRSLTRNVLSTSFAERTVKLVMNLEDVDDVTEILRES
jgi:2-methylcitrate dehydratase PrpD